ncbi:hypothetical protein B0H19DRAFT_1109502 [Mycena capillaripes]|nr:hypothetical protein B0H19DRAFT_1109502 [Mycena capillaripes]
MIRWILLPLGLTATVVPGLRATFCSQLRNVAVDLLSLLGLISILCITPKRTLCLPLIQKPLTRPRICIRAPIQNAKGARWMDDFSSQALELHNVGVYTVTAKFAVDGIETEVVKTVRTVWTSPEVSPFHDLYAVLQEDKRAAEPDRHEVAHPAPSRAQFREHAQQKRITGELLDRLAQQTHPVNNNRVLLFPL